MGTRIRIKATLHTYQPQGETPAMPTNRTLEQLAANPWQLRDDLPDTVAIFVEIISAVDPATGHAYPSRSEQQGDICFHTNHCAHTPRNGAMDPEHWIFGIPREVLELAWEGAAGRQSTLAVTSSVENVGFCRRCVLTRPTPAIEAKRCAPLSSTTLPGGHSPRSPSNAPAPGCR